MSPATIIVGVILAAVIISIVVVQIRNMKKGRHSCSCGGNCCSCGLCNSCRQEDDKADKKTAVKK